MLRGGFALCAAILLYAVVYLLTLPTVGSFGELTELAKEFIETALTTAVIGGFGGALIELLKNRT